MKILMALLLTIGLVGPSAHAHSFSDSFLSVDNRGQALSSEWHISLQDLELAVGLDSNQDGRIAWGELQGRRQNVEAYAFSRLSYGADLDRCRHLGRELLVEVRRDVPYAVLRFDSLCDGITGDMPLKVTYDLMFDVDPQHRGFIKLAGDDGAASIVRPDSPSATVQPKATFLSTALVYVQEGIWHIWTGFDHLLFVLTLLLGALCVTQSRLPWNETIKIVTAFTVAHSITLMLGALHVVSVSSFWIELTIAASITAAAITNLLPRLEPYRSGLAFGFGLIHGFGFAGVLETLSLSGKAFATALLSFNVGVELGQLVVVGAFLILIRAWRLLGIKPHQLKRVGSIAIAATGLVWVIYRAAG